MAHPLAPTTTQERTVLHPDEPCYALVEFNLPPPDYGPRHRYQLVGVFRDDKRAWVRIDLGLETDFAWADEFRLEADGDEDTVAMCMDLADNRRHDDYWLKFLGSQDPEKLKRDWVDQTEERQRIVRNVSIFGPYHRWQRNGCPILKGGQA